MSKEKNLPPTKKKISKAQKQGDLAKSKELTNAFEIVMLCLILPWSSSYVFLCFKTYLSYLSISQDVQVINILQGLIIKCLLWALMPLVVILFFGLFIELAQGGAFFNLNQVGLKWTRLSPGEGFKRIWSRGGEMSFLPKGPLVEVSKSLVWLSMSFAGTLMILKRDLEKIFFGQSTDIGMVFRAYYGLGLKCIAFLCFLVLLIGSFDYFRVRKERFYRLQMDLSELKQEIRESEGDPEIKVMRRQMQQELLLSGALTYLRKAKVVLWGKS